MNLSLTTKTSAIISVVAFVLIYIGTTTLSLNADRLQNSYLVSMQFQLVDLLDAVVIDLNRAQASEREYLLTLNPKAKADERFYLSQVDDNISRLKLLLSAKSRYIMLLEDLVESISFRKSCAEEVMQVRETAGYDRAIERSHKFDEEGMTQHVEWLARDVSRTINGEVTQRFNDLDRDSVTGMIGITIILASALGALVIVILGINRYVQERMRSENELKLAQQALSEREARMRALVDTAPDGIVSVRTSGSIESANAVFEQMFQYQPGELTGTSIERLMPGFLLGDLSAENLEAVAAAMGTVRELTGVKKDGTTVPVEVSISVVELGAQKVFTGIVRDITERRLVEERVKDFYSMVSHELRTPLASIRTALGLMEATFAEDDSSRSLAVVKIASEEADRLMRLINEILDMRKIESGKLELACDIYSATRLVEASVSGISSLAEQSEVTVVKQLAPGLEVLCDLDRSIQVLTNMLSNALKYSPPGEEIIVRTEALPGFCRFTVEDRGPGIPKAQTNKIFGRFEQLRAMDGRARAGSGLGLAIAKAIVEEHGGQIGVELPESGGSIFWFTLPDASDEEIDEDQESDTEHESDPEQESKKDQVLVSDKAQLSNQEKSTEPLKEN